MNHDMTPQTHHQSVISSAHVERPQCVVNLFVVLFTGGVFVSNTAPCS